jgi:hypothetical protein
MPGASVRQVSGWAVALLLVAGAGAVASLIATVTFPDFQLPLISGVVLVVLAASPLIVRLRWNGADLPGLYGLFSALFLGVTSLVWNGTPSLQTPRVQTSDVTAALNLVALSLVAFGIGAWLASRPKRARLLSFSPTSAPDRRALIVAFGASVALTIPAFASGAYGYNAAAQSLQFNGVVNLLSAVGPLVVLATALAYYGAGRTDLREPLIAMVVIQIAIGFAAGFKQNALDPVVLLAFAYVLTRGRYPWRAILVAIPLVFLVVIPANSAFRSATRREGQSTTRALQQVLAGTRPSSHAPSAVQEAFDYTFVRFRLIDSVALINSATPSVYPYANGEKYKLLPALVVAPRVLWPTKPQFDEGSQFAHMYMGLPSSIETSTGMTEIGDLYRNFGRYGLLVGMLLWGAVIGLWQRLADKGLTPRGAMIHAYAILHYGIYIESDIPNLISIASKTLPVALVIAWLLLPGRSGVPGYRRVIGSRPHSVEPAKSLPR